MIEFAQRSALHFEPGESAAFAVDITGNQYTTPNGAEVTLKDLARLKYVEGVLRFRLSLSAADSVGVAVVEVKALGNVLGSKTITFDGESVYRGDIVVNLQGLGGGAPLTIEVNGTTAAAASVTASLAAVLDVEHPLVIGVA